jgi:hypothetical protein
VRESQEERSQLASLFEEARTTVQQLQAELDEAQSTIIDLTTPGVRKSVNVSQIA